MLTQAAAGPAGGCISINGQSSGAAGSCFDAPDDSLTLGSVVEVDPSGESVYVGGLATNLTVYRRDSATGLLTRIECLHETGGFGCKDVTAIGSPFDLAFTADGSDVLTASITGQPRSSTATPRTAR